MGKGAKWAAKEDEALAEAWVEASDPSSGVTITSDQFWEAVYARWVQLRGGESPARSEKAIKTRWQVLTHTVQRFEALLAQVEVANPAEPRDMLFDLANREFLREQNVLFDRQRVWTVLTQCPRWSSNPRSLRKLLRVRKAIVLKEEEEVGEEGEEAGKKRHKRLGAAAAAVSSKNNGDNQGQGADTQQTDKTQPNTERTDVERADTQRNDTQQSDVLQANMRQPTVQQSHAQQTDTQRIDRQRLERLAPAPRGHGAAGRPISAFASSLQRLNDRELDDTDVVDDQVATIAAVGQQLHASSASASATGNTTDACAAALTDLAKAQREKNDLVADQMLMTMLLADSMDLRNRAALEQLKIKYLQRAFATDARQS